MDSIPSIPITPAKPTLLSEFKEFFPEFDNPKFPDNRIKLHLRLAAELVSKDKWGETYSYGVSLIAAHRLSLSQSAALSDGSVNVNSDLIATSKNVGGVSVSYASPLATTSTAGDAYWNSTPYGRQFLALRDIFGIGVISL